MSLAFPLPYGTPEAHGISSAAISAFVAGAERGLDAVHGFMLLRHGHIIAKGWWEPYQPLEPHAVFSLSKSFTSTAIGLLIAEGRLSLDVPVLAIFPDEAPPEPSANLKAMRVRHLLSMSTGHTFDTMVAMAGQADRSWVQVFLEQPIEHEPGKQFSYQNGATYLLSAIVHKLSGGRMLDYLQSRLFRPLGIANARWETSPQGIDTGGWGLSVTTADIAAFGQLYLQEGLWRGSRILPQAWVEQATSLQISNGSSATSDWEQGYGYQFFRCRYGAYMGAGAFGQYCLVMPAQDAVLAITAGLGDMLVLDLVWEHLLPVMGSAPLPEDATAQTALANKLASLQLRTPQGQPLSTTAARVSGQHFAMTENRQGIKEITFDFGFGETLITIRNDQGEQHIACGYERWLIGAASLGPIDNSSHYAALRNPGPWKVGASGAWTDESTYSAKLWWYETPHAWTLTCRFERDRLTVQQQTNFTMGPSEAVLLQGRLP